MGNVYEREVRGFFRAGGPFSKLLGSFEERPEQEEMAAAALRALESESILIVEAGTGTGKTLAYLVPALYSGRRVVISTATKALQEQLVTKDLPVLAREFDFSAAVMKGRGNYLCWRRYREFGRAPSFSFKEEIGHFGKIERWASKTKTGDRSEIKGLPDHYPTWREISASSEQCLGQKCPDFRQCFITAMRQAAKEADIVVVNHHLFFADLAIRSDSPGQILPLYGTLIFDEAHALPEIATEYFGAQVSTWRISDLGHDVRRLQRLGGLPVEELRAVVKVLERSEAAAGEALSAVRDSGLYQGDNEGSRFLLGPILKREAVIEAGERAALGLAELASALTAVGGKDENVKMLAERARLIGREMSFIMAGADENHVFWAENRKNGVILRASPVELEPILAPRLFEPAIPLIFTSATLAVQKNRRAAFDHFRDAMGLRESPRKLEEVWLPSSYDWKRNAMLYVPEDLPEPQEPGFIRAAAARMREILEASRGRAFLLFTSFRNMETAYELLAPDLPYTSLKQGDAPKGELLEEFRRDEASVLFATQSFWEGVDVSGQSLSCVVVDKLPFASPSDPLVSARIDRMRKAGKNPFMDFQLPAAVISLKQGLGRLIRTRADYGILAVLDVRIHKKRYGSVFLESLPRMERASTPADLADFIRKHEQANG